MRRAWLDTTRVQLNSFFVSAMSSVAVSVSLSIYCGCFHLIPKMMFFFSSVLSVLFMFCLPESRKYLFISTHPKNGLMASSSFCISVNQFALFIEKPILNKHCSSYTLSNILKFFWGKTPHSCGGGRGCLGFQLRYRFSQHLIIIYNTVKKST